MNDRRREALARAGANSQAQVFETAEPGDRFCVWNSNGVKLVKVTRITVARGSRYEEPGGRVVWVRPYNLSCQEWQKSEQRLTSGVRIVSSYSAEHRRKVAQVGEAVAEGV